MIPAIDYTDEDCRDLLRAIHPKAKVAFEDMKLAERLRKAMDFSEIHESIARTEGLIQAARNEAVKS